MKLNKGLCLYLLATHIHTHKLSTAHYNVMKARFASKCPECNEQIVVGKEITKNSSGIWVHNFCSDSETELP